jgi:putative ABC transport system permease protein
VEQVGAVDLSWSSMAAMYALVAVPLAILLSLRTGLVRQAAIAVLRMTIQLGLVAIYLELIFRLNNIWLNLAWVLAMVAIATFTAVRSAGLRLGPFIGPAAVGIAAGSLAVVSVFVVGVVRPEPLYDAHVLIPITGMVLGNSLRTNVVSLERFYSSIRTGQREYLGYLMLGATQREATVPYLRESLRAAALPTIATMSTLGLVALPGMMTGQILGGSLPLVAIKYQLAIMIAIFTATVTTALVTIALSTRVAFDDYQMLRPEIFRK